MRILLLLVTVLLTFTYSFSQTKGLILEPASSVLGKSVLDPNGDGYVSQSSSGFSANDVSESEIPFYKDENKYPEALHQKNRRTDFVIVKILN
jgi:hypothetical protein